VTAGGHAAPQAGASARVGALTSAYLRDRDADPKPSYGDFAALLDDVVFGTLPTTAVEDLLLAWWEVEDACREHRIALARTGLGLFHH
jgi:hypothetical protein